MNYKHTLFFSFFLSMSHLLTAIDCQLNWSCWSNTPSISIETQLAESCSAGVKVAVKGINLFAVYVAYKNYYALSTKQKLSLLTNPNLFLNTQASVYVTHKNENFSVKAQITKKKNIPASLSLHSSHTITESCSLKEQLTLHQDEDPEYMIALCYNKNSFHKNKSNAPNTLLDSLGLKIQGHLKNNNPLYTSVSCFMPVSTTLGIKGDICLINNTVIPLTFNNIKIYTPQKEGILGHVNATVLNIAIPSALYVVYKEKKIHFPDEEYNQAYAQTILASLNRYKANLDNKMNQLKKELS